MHVGADPKVRLGVLDECGIDAQIIFPSTIGLGGQDLGLVDDEALCRLAVEIYNDGMAEIQADSGNRLLPLPLMPAWSVETCVAEARRVAALGARGVNMTSDPQDLGAPDLASHAWDPLWEACTELQLPVHFHIGASVTGMTFYGKYPGFAPREHQARHRGHPAVHRQRPGRDQPDPVGHVRPPPRPQDGVGRERRGLVPFILETLDYEMAENAPQELAQLKKMPSEYFRSNLYATFWFENNRNKLPDLIEAVGEDNILFETDFPHPTHVPVAARDRRREDDHAPARDPAQDHGAKTPASCTGLEPAASHRA